MSVDQRTQNMKLNRLHISIYIKQAKQHISTNAIQQHTSTRTKDWK
jgi:hypothetical protein